MVIGRLNELRLQSWVAQLRYRALGPWIKSKFPNKNHVGKNNVINHPWPGMVLKNGDDWGMVYDFCFTHIINGNFRIPIFCGDIPLHRPEK